MSILKRVGNPGNPRGKYKVRSIEDAKSILQMSDKNFLIFIRVPLNIKKILTNEYYRAAFNEKIDEIIGRTK